jgi:hypothetical protein
LRDRLALPGSFGAHCIDGVKVGGGESEVCAIRGLSLSAYQPHFEIEAEPRKVGNAVKSTLTPGHHCLSRPLYSLFRT